LADRLRLTILGCGSSPGTPRINGDWGKCDPANPKNRRSRAAALVERISGEGVTSVVIDTGPDFRGQMLMAGVKHIDAVVYTHPHADHIHGIDDLRSYWLERRQLIDIHADAPTLLRLRQAFGYCFETPPGSDYPPLVKGYPIVAGERVEIVGKGGALTAMPVRQIHGRISSLAFRIGGLAYSPDMSDLDDEAQYQLQGLDVWIVDALRPTPHPSHLSVDEALAWIERLKPKRAILTHMHVDLDYDTLRRTLPSHVEPGFDGMVIELPA